VRSTRYSLSPRARVGLLLFVSSLVLVPDAAASAAAGDPDPTFGGDVIVTTEFGNSMESASDVAIQADGRVVVVGEVGFDRRNARSESLGTTSTARLTRRSAEATGRSSPTSRAASIGHPA